MKLIPEETRIHQINALPNIQFVRWESGFKNSKSKAICRCSVDGFEWAASVNNLVDSGHGCPKCGNIRRADAQRVPALEREQQINAMPGIEFVRWVDGYRNLRSKAVCRCSIHGCEWSAEANSLVNGGCGCQKCGRLSSANIRRQPESEAINKINNLPNIQFLRWDGEYKNSVSKAVCLCGVCRHVWAVRVVSLTSNGHGCPKCGLVRRVDSRRTSEEQYLHRLSAKPNVTFVKWANGYVDSYSKAICRCDTCGHKWPAPINHLVNSGSGCPKCAPFGYDKFKPGTLYVLRSECGSMVKIGISNNYEERHAQLRRRTPFDWSCIELLHGDGAAIADMEKELHSITEQATFSEPFEGYTEWRKWEPRLLKWVDRYRTRLARYNKAP